MHFYSRKRLLNENINEFNIIKILQKTKTL